VRDLSVDDETVVAAAEFLGLIAKPDNRKPKADGRRPK
jgi:hypothetical protein